MRYLLTFAISFYQLFISPLLSALTGNSSACRYQPTCSEYAKQVIQQHGIVKGIQLVLMRLATCHPFAKPSGV